MYEVHAYVRYTAMPICGTALGARLYMVTLDVHVCEGCTPMCEVRAYM